MTCRLQMEMASHGGDDARSSSSSEDSAISVVDVVMKKHALTNRRSALQFAVGAVSASPMLFNIPSATAAAPPAKTAFPTWTLDGNVKFPTLALNTVGLSADETVYAMELATPLGFTHIDFHPGKERDGVASYLKNHPEKRKDLFLNTKIRKPKPGTRAEDAAKLAMAQIDEDFSILGVDYVDMLMLRDSPDCDVMQAQWAVMEDALAKGRTRSIGVINYCEGSLKCILETANVKPALNYYMVHVGIQNPTAKSLRNYCDKKGIKTFGYGAVGEPGPNQEILENDMLEKIGQNHGKTPAEVALRWVIQGGAAVSVRPTTEFGLGFGKCTEENGCQESLKQRADVLSWKLTKGEMSQLNALTAPDDNPTLFSSAGCPNSFVMPK
eukprot:CAMPEP_0181104474 /NCGR_PEP_ID=MMETSP1071-20121207/15452_1 /TAXON_ID=35127 /ORGANISM="Thalassiosira sp., Strain NH16" /LENGTH=382 /DNA_ID=CAMNT_0023187685 /DNA_START=156 /DNA_END=1304 /DNA_ORIENTATION=+